MAKPASAARILAIIRALDWHGHVELSDNDMNWLASELAVALNPDGDTDLCEVCDRIRTIVVRTTLGRICEDCLDALAEEASEARDEVEEG